MNEPSVEKESFDIKLFLQLLAKRCEASNATKDQDVLLLLGRTGVGKSTTLHFLAGSEMEKQVVAGIEHIAPVNFRNKALSAVTTSPHAQSETREIYAIPITFSHIGLNREGGIVCCDTPGLEDTHGPEVEMANNIALINALRVCKSVRPVIVISNKSIGDRGELLKALLYLLTTVFINVNDYVDTFSYCLTKHTPQGLENFNAFLKSLKSCLSIEEKSNLALMVLFNSMIEETEDEIIAINPLVDNPGQLLRKLIKKPAIQHPNEVFQYSAIEKYKPILHEQIYQHRLNIQRAINSNNYELVLSKFVELKDLSAALKFDFVQQVYDESLHYLTEHTDECYKAISTIVARILLSDEILNEWDIDECRKLFSQWQSAVNLRNLINYKKQLADFIKQIGSQTLICKRDFDDIGVILNKFERLSEIFSDISEFYAAVQKKRDVYLIEQVASFNELHQKIIRIYELRKEEGFEELALLVKEMSDSHQKPYLTSMTTDVYHQTLKLLNDWIGELKLKAQGQVMQFITNKDPFIVNALVKSLLYLDKAAWLDSYLIDVSKTIKYETHEAILNHFFELRNNLTSLDFALGNSENIQKLYNGLLYFQEVQSLEKIIPRLTEIRESLMRLFDESALENLKLINYLFDNEGHAWYELQRLKSEYDRLMEKAFDSADAKATSYLERHGFYDISNLEERISELNNEMDELGIKIEAVSIKCKDLAEHSTQLRNVSNDKISGDGYIASSFYFFKNAYSYAQSWFASKGYSEREKCAEVSSLSSVITEIDYLLASISSEMHSKEKELIQLFTVRDRYHEIFKNEVTLLKSHALALVKKHQFDTVDILVERIEAKKIRIVEKINIFNRNKIFCTGFNLDYFSLTYDYINIFRNHSIFSIEVKQAVESFHKFMVLYARFVQKKLCMFFENIVVGNYFDIQLSFYMVQHYLREIEALHKQHQKLYIIFEKNHIYNLNEPLQAGLSELSDQLFDCAQSYNLSLLLSKLAIVKLLIPLDYYTTYKSDKSFNTLYQCYLRKFYALIEEVYQGAVTNINRDAYFNVKNNMEILLRLADDKNEVATKHVVLLRRMLSSKLVRLVTSVKQKMILLNKVRSSADNFRIIKDIESLTIFKDCCKNYIDQDVLNIDDFVNTIEETMTTLKSLFIGRLALAESMLDSPEFYFYELEENIALINESHLLFVRYMTGAINDRVHILSQRLEQKFDVALSKCLSLDIDNYHRFPPILMFQALEKFELSDNARYRRALVALREATINKFAKELKEALTWPGIIDNNRSINKCKSALAYLSGNLKALLEVNIQRCIDEITDREYLRLPKNTP
jgi:hypothetical protein